MCIRDSFLYREVLHIDIDPVLIPSAKRPQRLPAVLTRDDVLRLPNALDGVYKFPAPRRSVDPQQEGTSPPH
ncbi:MAG: hypothetical protein N2508_02395, partial [Anaerolineae bacterium]|nr:hypothetical protein [Anaerolineae bacterium]